MHALTRGDLVIRAELHCAVVHCGHWAFTRIAEAGRARLTREENIDIDEDDESRARARPLKAS